MISYNIVTLPVTILFWINAGIWLYYGLQLKKSYEVHNFVNTMATVVLWVVAGACYPFFSQSDAYFLANPIQVENFQLLATIFIVGVTPFLLFLILYYQKRVIAKQPELKEQRTIDNLLKKYGIDKNAFGKRVANAKPVNGEHYSLRIDLKRKLLHFVPAIAVVGLWLFATRIWAGMWGFESVWQISGENFGYFLMLTAGFSGIMIFAVLEYVRFSYLFPKRSVYHLLPNNVLKLLCDAMKPAEFTEFIKPVPLILAFVPVFFLPFGAFAAVTLGATLGDGAASVIGKAWGKHHWPKNSLKTIEGYIGGFIVTFLISVGCLFLFGTYMLPEIVLLAVVNATVFTLIDMWNPPIDDNILNPLLCGAGLAITLLLL